MSTKPVSFEVEAILAAAGIERPTHAQRDGVRRALALYARSVCPRTALGRERWKQRAMRLRKRYAPATEWAAVDGDDET